MLKIYENLFERLNKEGILYCHFKSNDHLEAGLNGDTDLDIVVRSDYARALTKILIEFDFKRTEAGFGVKNHAREGYLGLDKETKKLVYIDLHFTIIIGKNRIREYALDGLSDQILSTRILDDKYPIYIASSTYELVLLIIRAAIKVRFRDKLWKLFGKDFFDKSWQVQHDWLLQRTTPDELVQVSKNLLTTEATIPEDWHLHYPTIGELFQIKKLFKKKYFGYLKYNDFTSNIGMFAKEVNGLLCFVNRRYCENRIPVNRRTLAMGGTFIGFIGVDGSGKSTHLKKLAEYLSWKLDVSCVYLGAGDGKSSWHRAILKLLRKVLEKNVNSTDVQSVKPDNAEKSSVRKLAKLVWAVSLMVEKNTKLKRFNRQARRGVVVIADRYPQSNINNFNDGPLLSGYRSSINKLNILRVLAEKEYEVYSGEKYPPPKLIIKLMVSPQTSIDRGQSADIEYLNRRIEAVNAITFKESCKVVGIDASGPEHEVFDEIIQIVWDNI